MTKRAAPERRRDALRRMLRLIVEEGALDDEGASVEALAARLGIGARQLSKLFAHHLSATPLQVAKTARVQRAKRLIDATDLAMAEVAMRAGFRSLRRFNAVFVEVYQRSPTGIRRFARAMGRGPGTRKTEGDDRHGTQLENLNPSYKATAT